MARVMVAPEINKQAVALVSEAEGLAKVYEKYEIKSNSGYVAAADDLKRIKTKINELETARKSITAPIDESKRRVMDFFRKPVEFLEAAERIIKQSLGTWQEEQERIRKEEEDRLRKQAEEEERKEKARLAEIARKEEEKAAELRKRAATEDDAKKKAKLRADAEAAAAKAREAKEQKAEVHVEAPVVASETPKVAGIATVVTWTYEILDETLIPRGYLIVDEKKLGAVARATKGTLEVPGVRFYFEKGISAGKK